MVKVGFGSSSLNIPFATTKLTTYNCAATTRYCMLRWFPVPPLVWVLGCKGAGVYGCWGVRVLGSMGAGSGGGVAGMGGGGPNCS